MCITIIASQNACIFKAPHHHPTFYECLTDEVIKWASLHTNGAAGPFSVDVYAWKHMCTPFKEASAGLCKALALYFPVIFISSKGPFSSDIFCHGHTQVSLPFGHFRIC